MPARVFELAPGGQYEPIKEVEPGAGLLDEAVLDDNGVQRTLFIHCDPLDRYSRMAFVTLEYGLSGDDDDYDLGEITEELPELEHQEESLFRLKRGLGNLLVVQHQCIQCPN
jgi:hypothetical protein